MGKIKQGILGGFANKVGTVVGSSWKGIAVMRSMPLSVANPRTTAQVANRGKFAQVVKNAQSILSSVVQPNFNPQAKYMSGYNMFVKLNKDLIDNTTIQAYATEMILAKGDLSCTLDSESSSVTGNVLRLAYDDTTPNAKDKSTDKIDACIVVFPKSGAEVGDVEVMHLNPTSPAAGTRASGSKEFGLPTIDVENNYVYVLAFFRSADGKITSNTESMRIDDIME